MANGLDLNKVQIVLKGKKTENFAPGVWQVHRKYDITMDGSRVGIIETLNTSLGLDYVTNFKVNPSMRGKGIGGPRAEQIL